MSVEPIYKENNDLLLDGEYARCFCVLSKLTGLDKKNVADEVNEAYVAYENEIPHNWTTWELRCAESKHWKERGEYEKIKNRPINAVWCYALSILIHTPHLTCSEVVYQVFLCFEPKFTNTHLERLWINARGQYDIYGKPISMYYQLEGRRSAQIWKSRSNLYGWW